MLPLSSFDLFYETLFEKIVSRSVTRNMSRGMDVVNQPVLSTASNWVNSNYTLSNFQATCKECEEILYFVSTENFEDHIKREHEVTYEFEEIVYELKEKFWENFRKIDDSTYVECVVCEKLFSYDDASNHRLCADDRQIVTDIGYNWAFKYYKMIDVLSAYCILCKRGGKEGSTNTLFDDIVFLHFKLYHTEKWGEEGLPFSEVLTAPLGVVNLKRLKLFLKICDDSEWKSTDAEDREIAINWVKRKYQLKPRFQAECKICFVIFSSIDTSSFRTHMFRVTPRISNAEHLKHGVYRNTLNWINFRTVKWKQKAKCVICNREFSLSSQHWKMHHHKKFEDNNHNIRHYTWQCKYVKEIKDGNDDFKGFCIACEPEHDFDFTPAIHLFIHIFKNKCQNLMRRDDSEPGNDPGPGNVSQPKDDLAMQRKRTERSTPYSKPSTSRDIN